MIPCISEMKFSLSFSISTPRILIHCNAFSSESLLCQKTQIPQSSSDGYFTSPYPWSETLSLWLRFDPIEWPGCPLPSCCSTAALLWWRGKSHLSSWIFLTCHLRGGNPALVARRRHGQPSARQGSFALLDHPEHRGSWCPCSWRGVVTRWSLRSIPTQTALWLWLIRKEKTSPMRPPPSPARRHREAGRWWWYRTGEYMLVILIDVLAQIRPWRLQHWLHQAGSCSSSWVWGGKQGTHYRAPVLVLPAGNH